MTFSIERVKNYKKQLTIKRWHLILTAVLLTIIVSLSFRLKIDTEENGWQLHTTFHLLYFHIGKQWYKFQHYQFSKRNELTKKRKTHQLFYMLFHTCTYIDIEKYWNSKEHTYVGMQTWTHTHTLTGMRIMITHRSS